MKQRALILLFVVFGLAVGLPAQSKEPLPVSVVPVAGPVYMLASGGNGNVGVVADTDGILMIDAMEEEMAGSLRAALKPLPGGDRVRVLVNTHWHWDHVSGNKAFGPAAVIVAHENTRALNAADQAMFGGTIKALPAGALPGLTYADKMTAHAGGLVLRLVHYPHAHTNGDTVIFIDALKIVHMGDMFFNGMFPFLDVPNGGSIDNWVRQLDVILAALPDDARIIPGHGPLAGRGELLAFRQMLYDSAELVRGQMKAGKTLEEIQAGSMPERFAPWAKGFMPVPGWLELVYRSLEKN
jgi:glyoxylase-like metal-dependent hydrolase (beta-lactamase superfamily II)